MNASDSILDEITRFIDKPSLELAREVKDEKDRVADIAFLYSDAINKTTLSTIMGVFHWFDGKIYVPIDKKEFEVRLMESMCKGGVSRRDITHSFTKMFAVSERFVWSKEYEIRRDVLCFDNCVVNLDTGETFPHSKDFHVVNKLDFDYDETATCPLWTKFLSEVLPDVKAQMVLQEFLGLIFVDRRNVKIEKMAFLYGTGSNGKSVVFETITGILGKNNVTHHELSDLTTHQSADYKVASINGKLLNYCSEVDKAELNGAKTKGLISGEDREARLPYGQSFRVDLIPLLMANANELPATTDHTKGYFRRMLIIPFEVEITRDKADLELSTKLRAEYSGIFNWIMEGRRRMAAKGYKFTESEAIDSKVNQYELESNSALYFMSEKRYYHSQIDLKDNGKEEKSSTLYNDYRTWCLETGVKPFSNKSFSMKLSEKGFITERKTSGVMYWLYNMPMASEASRVESKLPRQILISLCKYEHGFTPLEDVLKFYNNQDEIEVVKKPTIIPIEEVVEKPSQQTIDFEEDECP